MISKLSGQQSILDQEVVIYLIQELNGVMALSGLNGFRTLLGWNVDLFEFQAVQCWQLFLYNSSNKRRRTYAEALQSLV